MIKRSLLCLSLVISFCLMLYGPVAAQEKKAEKTEYVKVQQMFKNNLPSMLKEHYKEGGIDLDKQKVERVVVFDKTNNLDAIKESFEKPVVIYEERYRVVKDGDSEANTSGDVSILSLDIDPLTRVISYAGASVTCSGETTSDVISEGGSYSWYRMISSKGWWTRQNYGTQVVAWADRMRLYAFQAGAVKPGTGTNTNPVNYDKTFTYGSNLAGGTHNKSFSHTEYTSVSNFGICGTYHEFNCCFARPGYPVVQQPTEFNTGVGGVYIPY